MTDHSCYTDEQLLDLLKNADEQAFTELYHRYWKLVYYVVYKRVNDLSLAEEAVQEIFADLWHRRQRLQVRASLKYYLSAAAQYQVMTHLAKAKKQGIQSIAAEEYTIAGHLTADRFLQFHELEKQLQTLVNALPEKCRLVYEYSRQQGMSNKEIAQTLNISEKTVENQLTKALSRIRHGLTDAALLWFLFQTGGKL